MVDGMASTCWHRWFDGCAYGKSLSLVTWPENPALCVLCACVCCHLLVSTAVNWMMESGRHTLVMAKKLQASLQGQVTSTQYISQLLDPGRFFYSSNCCWCSHGMKWACLAKSALRNECVQQLFAWRTRFLSLATIYRSYSGSRLAYQGPLEVWWRNSYSIMMPAGVMLHSRFLWQVSRARLGGYGAGLCFI